LRTKTIITAAIIIALLTIICTPINITTTAAAQATQNQTIPSSGRIITVTAQQDARQVINVTNFDSNAIQEAINALPPEGGTIHLSSGVYDLNGKSVILRSNIKLAGEGIDQTIIRLYPTIHTASMAIEDAITSYDKITNLVISDLTVIQNVQQVRHHGGIVFRGDENDNIRITNVKVTDISGWGIGLSYGTNISIENCNVERAWTGIVFSYCNNVAIKGNTIKNTGGDGIFSEAQATQVVISDNYLENIGDTAIDIAGSALAGPQSEQEIEVINNSIINGSIRITNALNVKVTSNTILNGAINVDGGQGSPINIDIKQNQVTSSGKVGIGFYGAVNASAEQNTIIMTTPGSNITQSGIVAAIWGNGLITENTIIGSANYGIDFAGWGLGSGNNIIIQNNQIQEFGTYGIYDNNKYISTVTIQHNTFITQNGASTIFTENTSNRWIMMENTINS
jgi:hypothetical protein